MNIDDFKSRLQFGGARPNLFEVELAFPFLVADGTEAAREAAFMCKGAQLPAKLHEPIVVPFRGREMKIAGDATFEEWTITIINDVDFVVRNAFERWMNSINTHQGNIGPDGPAEYMADLSVHQLDRKHNRVKSYTFIDAWPSNLAAIDLNYDNTNVIEEFEVTLQYQYWQADTTD